MARPLRIEFPDAFYHVLSRGNGGKNIFRLDNDYELFLETLKDCLERFHVLLHCYCLMTNHFHLLIQTREPNLAVFMKRLLGVYTIRFNRKYKRHGHLFQGRYKAFLVDKDSYLLELSRYIHLNPCQAGLVKSPEDYPWSSMHLFVNQKQKERRPFLYTGLILDEFESPRAYRSFVVERLGQEDDLTRKVIGGLFLGPEAFRDQFRSRILKNGARGISKARELVKVPVDRLNEFLQDQPEDFKIYGLWKIARRTQREIGELHSKTDSAISHAIKRFEAKMAKDRALRNQFKALEANASIFKN